MEELVYKFDKKSYLENWKGEAIAKVQFKYFFVHIWTLTPITQFTCSLARAGNKPVALARF